MSLFRLYQKGPEPPREATSHIASRCFRTGLLPILLLGLSGCATPALWKHTAARDWTPESYNARLFLASTNSEQDVIVVFRQSATVGKKLHYRLVAWNSSRPSSELAVGRKAVRQLTNSWEQVQILNCFPRDAVLGDAVSTSPGYAVYGPGRDQFTIHLEDAPSASFDLPPCKEKTRVALRAVGLPFAVTYDAVIICLAVGASGGGGYSYR